MYALYPNLVNPVILAKNPAIPAKTKRGPDFPSAAHVPKTSKMYAPDSNLVNPVILAKKPCNPG
jgi:hypothetical protein